MNTPAIVVIAYDRPDSLSRLLGSLARASYPENADVTLIISIDNSGKDATVNVAKDFAWEHGEKIVNARPERMGLKNHVLSCGDYVYEYGSIIVLEDDLFVSPAFYEYAVKVLDFTENDHRIGGVSLYNHLFNVHARKSFTAIDDGYDNWYFQFAQSWGQAYTKSQWEGFIKWYETHKDESIVKSNVPANVSGWSDKSWLKFYIAYLIDTDRFFIYPRISYTTNFGDAGSHAVKADTDLQVPLAGGRQSVYCTFSKLVQSSAVYDAFFENICLKDNIGEICINEKDDSPDDLMDDDLAKSKDIQSEMIIDLYGTKPIETMLEENPDFRYVLSTKRYPYGVLRSYGRAMRPIDANVVFDVPGEDIYLYDTKVHANAPAKQSEALPYLYEYRGISAKQMTSMIGYRVSEKIFKK